jgi:hypothetical protein
MTSQGFIASDSGAARDEACLRKPASIDFHAERVAAAAALWGGGIEVIEQEPIGMHAFTRHMLAGQGGDDEDDVSVGDEDDYDRTSKRRDAEDDGGDSDGDGSQRKSAQQKFAALQQQMLRSGASDAGPSQPQPKAHIAAVNMDELTGGLLDGSVRYWSDFQQVVRCSLRAMLASVTAGCYGAV